MPLTANTETEKGKGLPNAPSKCGKCAICLLFGMRLQETGKRPCKCKTSRSKLIRIRLLFRVKFDDTSDFDSYREAVSKVRDELWEQETCTRKQHTTRTHTHTCTHTSDTVSLHDHCWWMNGTCTLGNTASGQTQAAVPVGLCPSALSGYLQVQPTILTSRRGLSPRFCFCVCPLIMGRNSQGTDMRSLLFLAFLNGC